MKIRFTKLQFFIMVGLVIFVALFGGIIFCNFFYRFKHPLVLVITILFPMLVLCPFSLFIASDKWEIKE